ncbi:hypothetical protein [Microtetraspora sp. NBRC 16547]|uniref:hypothetical protein n=1 Tax=Microtetraspora sp. NBRC 16547 TaxID=3030993 RepID=UPI00249FA305|nr:hypothetical protein [Microtetraspora sp. NBRC 16547]GLX01959.1 hypothetical protein Misp02_60450 [Microtetraspora sp. NBRC 16547]
MIRRFFYITVGACLAVWAMRKLQAMRPENVARRAAGRAAGIAGELVEFAGDVRALARERETELRARMGLESLDRNHDHDVKDGR